MQNINIKERSNDTIILLDLKLNSFNSNDLINVHLHLLHIPVYYDNVVIIYSIRYHVITNRVLCFIPPYGVTAVTENVSTNNKKWPQSYYLFSSYNNNIVKRSSENHDMENFFYDINNLASIFMGLAKSSPT